MIAGTYFHFHVCCMFSMNSFKFYSYVYCITKQKQAIQTSIGSMNMVRILSISATVLVMDLIRRCCTFMFITEHGMWFYIDCNICSCYAGEITCRKKQCEVTSLGVLDPAYTSLPCNCPPHHVPVCGRNGNTYPSSCLAR